MSFDVGVLDDDFRYLKELHIGESIYGLLFRKLITLEEYPFLGKVKAEKEEDFVVPPEQVGDLVAELNKLEAYLKGEKLMAAEIKAKCLGFVAQLKDVCEAAKEHGKSVDFIAGE